jgi:hypothetical protein
MRTKNMGKLIKVAAQSRTQNINFVVQGESGSATYDLAQVYKENQYMPERRSPESNLDVIKSAIVEFYAQYDITLSESSASISYHNSSTSFSFSTAFNMHSTIGSTANQHAMNVFRDSFRREVNVGGEKYRIVVWVYS